MKITQAVVWCVWMMYVGVVGAWYEGLSHLLPEERDAAPLVQVRARVMKMWSGLDILCAVNLGTIDRDTVSEHMYADALLCYHYLGMIKSCDVPPGSSAAQELLSLAEIISHIRVTFAEIFRYDNPVVLHAADSVFFQMLRHCSMIASQDISPMLSLTYEGQCAV